jgi:type IV pilus assembly protein PilM
MAKVETILAVDIGADSLKIAEFSYPPQGGMILESFAFVEYGADIKEEELLPALAAAFHTAMEEHQFQSRKVHLSISGQSAFTKFVKLPPVGDDKSRISQLVDYEARQNIPFPINEVVWDYQLIQSSDEQEQGEIEVMFVVVKSDFIEGITKVFESVGMETTIVEVAPCSCYNAARANNLGEDECVMLLNIGGKCSNLVFIDSGRFYVRPIPIAGQTITQQVAKEFGIPYPDAEEMKRRHGFVALGGAYEEPDSEVSATVSKIVRNTMTRLHGEINRSINVYRAQQKGKKPMKLFLAGGSSVMAFTPRFFAEKLRIPVEYFNPFQVVSLSPAIDRENLAEVAHMFSEVIGLGLRHATVCPIEISLVPESVKRQHELKLKRPYFYSSAAAMVMCLGVAWMGLSQQDNYFKKHIKTAEDKLLKTNQDSRLVRTANNQLLDTQRKYEDAKKILDQRDIWLKLLDEIQVVLPDRMWLVKIQATDSAGETTARRTPEKDAGDIFSLFGQSASSAKAPTSTKKEWIEMEGHSMYEKGVISYLDILKGNLKKSPFFSDAEDGITTNYYIPASGNNNVDSFKVTAKLKEPLK